LYGSDKLPNLEQAISAIVSEEIRLNLESTGTGVQGVMHRRSALFAAGGSNYFHKHGNTLTERNCFECGQPGHMRASCPELIGGRRGRGQEWRGRRRGRVVDGFTARRGGGRYSRGRAH
jgi:hypothetical protein